MGLDTVELVIALEAAFDIEIPNEEAGSMLTPRLVVDGIYEKVRSPLPEDNGCLTLRAFFRLRDGFAAEGVSPRAVRLETKVADLLPGPRRRDALNAVLARTGGLQRPRLPFGLQFTFGDVGDLVADSVVKQQHALRLPGHGWSKGQVREVVRTVIRAQLPLRRFSDDAHFVKDLGVD